MNYAALTAAGFYSRAPFYVMAFTLTAAQATTESLGAEQKNKAAPSEVIFNTSRLQSLKMDATQAQLLGKTARFLQGTHRVTLFVNSVSRGEVNALFNAEGQVCAEQKLLARGQLRVPEKFATPLPEGECKEISDVFPGSMVELRPGKSEVHLIVPLEALQPQEGNIKHYESGGIAALFNYDALVTRSENRGQSASEYRYLSTLAGFNAGDWLFRSSQSYSASGDRSLLTHLYAYAQKTFAAIGSTFQGGQINTANSVFSGIPLSGVQLLPEDSLRANADESPIQIEGIANSAGRVEVHQNGAMVHTSMVPAGAFTLTGLVLNRQRDIEVTVVENNGSRSSFTVHAAGLQNSAFNTAPGYSVAMGRYRSYGKGEGEQPPLITASGTWPISPHTQLAAGVLGAQSYQGVAASLGYRITPTTRLDFSQAVSNSPEARKSGASATAALSTQVTPTLGFSVNTTQNSEGYRDFQDTLYKKPAVPDVDEYFNDYFDEYRPVKPEQRFRARTRSQYGAAVSWSNPTLGGFSLSTSYAQRFDSQSAQYLSGNWSKNFGKVNATLTVQKNTDNSHSHKDAGLTTYLSVSMPLGTQGRAFINADKERTRSGMSYGDRVNDSFGYDVRADHDDHNHRTNLAVTANVLPRFANASVNYSRSSENSSSSSGTLSGAIVAHGKGVTLSPYPVDDTFGIVSAGDLSGLKIVTPRGPVWTDPFGQAVVASLSPHRESQVAIVGDALPRNVDIGNSVKKINAGRGSVSRLEFDVSVTRRVLMKVIGPDGAPIPRGLAVLDNREQYVTTSIGDGKLYFAHIDPDQALNISLLDNTTCRVNYLLPKQADLSKVLETIDATCTII